MVKKFLHKTVQLLKRFLKSTWRKINILLDKLALQRLRSRLKRDELIDLFKKIQSDHTGAPLDINLALNLQQFKNKKIKDVMTKLNEIKKVKATDQAGPIIINELHRSGQKYFLVEDKEEIVGTITLGELSALRTSGKIKSFMKRELYYIDAASNTFAIFNQFFDSSSNIFLVKDGQNVVGAVNMDNFLQDLLLL